jgi:hypothetical protein
MLPDMSPSKLSNYEQGVNPKVETIIAFVNLFNEKYNAGLNLDRIILSDLDEERYTFPIDESKIDNHISEPRLLEDKKIEINKSTIDKLVEAQLNLTKILANNLNT